MSPSPDLRTTKVAKDISLLDMDDYIGFGHTEFPDGSRSHVCLICGENKSKDYVFWVPALKHVWAKHRDRVLADKRKKLSHQSIRLAQIDDESLRDKEIK